MILLRQSLSGCHEALVQWVAAVAERRIGFGKARMVISLGWHLVDCHEALVRLAAAVKAYVDLTEYEKLPLD